MKKEILIYADGSSLGNPGNGGWGTIISRGNKILELGGGDKHTTNNRMELTGVIEGLSHVKEKKGIIVRTDSSYVINGITKWVKGWEKSGWIGTNKKEILNQDLWKKLSKLVKGKDIDWEYVPGHSGVVGNERVDFIATLCAKEKQFKTQKFFDGPLSKYPFDIFNVTKTKTKPKKSKSSSSKSPAYSYLSLVNGVLVKHQTWAECEKRVKGASGAKFKKSTSPSDEQKIMEDWGLTGNKNLFS